MNILLDNVKSTFFSSVLFSHLNEKIKLKMIKYNKNVQNKIDINLNYYKLINIKNILY